MGEPSTGVSLMEVVARRLRKAADGDHGGEDMAAVYRRQATCTPIHSSSAPGPPTDKHWSCALSRNPERQPELDNLRAVGRAVRATLIPAESAIGSFAF
jgi:hypothetical protein